MVKLETIVIDAGHGGKDPGAINGKIYEKEITLSIALKLGELIKAGYPDVKVVYTRSSDVFIPVYERAEIANKNHADLFISIHTNSAKETAARGSETFVMGLDKTNSNLEVCQLENSVIVMEDDYSSRYEGFDPKNPESYIIFSLLQNSHLEQSLIFASYIQKNFMSGPISHDRGIKQDIFLVLWKCTMPSVLVEVGFISNQSDCKVMTSDANQLKIANSLYQAFVKYKKQYDTEIEMNEKKNDTGRYAIQVMASSTYLPKGSKEFKGEDCTYVRSGNLYKYIVGKYSTKKEADSTLVRIKKKFPQAYIITLAQ